MAEKNQTMNREHSARFSRPYARAAFDYAMEHQALDQWSRMLRTVAAYIQDGQMIQLFANPQYTREALGDFVLALAKDALDPACKNFIQLLTCNGRLSLLPEIYLLFEQLRAAIQATRQVQIKSVVPLTDAHLSQLQATLSKRFGQPVILETEIDPHLLGGFVIYSGDHVIDNSVRGRFKKLKIALTQ